MQPMFKSTEIEHRQTYRPQPIEPRQRSKPWVVPVALAFLIVLLLVALVALGQQVPSGETIVTTTTTPFDLAP